MITIQSLKPIIPQIRAAADRMVQCMREGGKVLWMGNGGSAADAQHMAAELVGRYEHDRQGYASIALTTDSSILTSVGNDYGFEAIFERQIEALCTPKDVVIGFSTSGKSTNIIRGFRKARDTKAYTIGIAGRDGGELMGIVDLPLLVPSEKTARIQEGHQLIGHIICERVEAAMTLESRKT
ncbi:SIS domain-containing protein [Candidatus Neomarinimicrobiota bacterium]